MDSIVYSYPLPAETAIFFVFSFNTNKYLTHLYNRIWIRAYPNLGSDFHVNLCQFPELNKIKLARN